jgi:hypothetical protein
MSYTLDPSKAFVDIDGMSLYKYNITPLGSKSDEDREFINVEISLSGGLGRVHIDGLGNKFVEDEVQIGASSIFNLTADDITKMAELFLNWQKVSPPLRYLDFGEKAVILEDSDTFIVMPKGNRELNFNLPIN